VSTNGMELRRLGRTGRDVSVVGLGCWQLGSDWGELDRRQAFAILEAAMDAGVTFLDTADVYGDGRSESLIGEFLSGRENTGLTVATKMGRRSEPRTADAYTLAHFRSWVDRSRRNLSVDTVDLIQLHCPPSAVYHDDRVFDALETLVAEHRAAAYGVSVETVDEALVAIARPRVATVQIILNVFRRRPLEQVLPAAQRAGVGIIARVPLASGLLSGKYDESTTFPPDDHRNYNRHGEAFDIGETFSGVPFEVGVEAAREVARWTPASATTAQLALRWIIDQPGVTTVIPGARTPEQARANAAAATLEPLSAEIHTALADLYNQCIRQYVQSRW
jgi:aryl-alcohol dehydrogenase-like predicted oxidoreductase